MLTVYRQDKLLWSLWVLALLMTFAVEFSSYRNGYTLAGSITLGLILSFTSVKLSLNAKARRDKLKAYFSELSMMQVPMYEGLTPRGMRASHAAHVKAMCLFYGGSPREIFGDTMLREWITFHHEQAIWRAGLEAGVTREAVTSFLYSTLDVPFLMGLEDRRRELRMDPAIIPPWGMIARDLDSLPSDPYFGRRPEQVVQRLETRRQELSRSLSQSQAVALIYQPFDQAPIPLELRERIIDAHAYHAGTLWWVLSSSSIPTLSHYADLLVVAQRPGGGVPTSQGSLEFSGTPFVPEQSGRLISLEVGNSAVFNFPGHRDTTQPGTGYVRINPPPPITRRGGIEQQQDRHNQAAKQMNNDPDNVDKPHDRFTFRKLRPKAGATRSSGSSSDPEPAPSRTGRPAWGFDFAGRSYPSPTEQRLRELDLSALELRALSRPYLPGEVRRTRPMAPSEDQGEQYQTSIAGVPFRVDSSLPPGTIRYVDQDGIVREHALGSMSLEPRGTVPVDAEGNPIPDVVEDEEEAEHGDEWAVHEVEEVEEADEESEDEYENRRLRERRESERIAEAPDRERAVLRILREQGAIGNAEFNAALAALRPVGQPASRRNEINFTGGSGLTFTETGRVVARSMVREQLMGGVPDLGDFCRRHLHLIGQGGRPVAAIVPYDSIRLTVERHTSRMARMDYVRGLDVIATYVFDSSIDASGCMVYTLSNLVAFIPLTIEE